MYLFVNIVNNVKIQIYYTFFSRGCTAHIFIFFFSSKINPKHIYIFLTLPATLSAEELEKQLSTQPQCWECCFSFSSIHRNFF